MSNCKVIMLLMVCAPVLATTTSPKLNGKRVLTSEFINQNAEAYKLEVWDDSKISPLELILR